MSIHFLTALTKSLAFLRSFSFSASSASLRRISLSSVIAPFALRSSTEAFVFWSSFLSFFDCLTCTMLFFASDRRLLKALKLESANATSVALSISNVSDMSYFSFLSFLASLVTLRARSRASFTRPDSSPVFRALLQREIDFE